MVPSGGRCCGDAAEASTADPVGGNDESCPNTKSPVSLCIGVGADSVSHLRNDFYFSPL